MSPPETTAMRTAGDASLGIGLPFSSTQPRAIAATSTLQTRVDQNLDGSLVSVNERLEAVRQQIIETNNASDKGG